MITINNTNLLLYDFENRLTQTTFAPTTNSYQYDGGGNRLSANRDGVVTRYVLDRNSSLTQVLAETDSGGTITAYYVYGLGLISRIDSGGNAQYYHFDSRGSTIALTDASGQITEAYAYDPFGRPMNLFVSDNRFRYLGRHGVMDEFGFVYVRARYYSTRRGRFLTKDPTTGNDSDGQSLNRYVYALNNPVGLIDISGLSPREASHISIVFATSDSSRLHNLLISPSTLGLDQRAQFQTSGLNFGALVGSALLKQTPEFLGKFGEFLAAGGGSGVPVNFSPSTWKVVQETLPGLEFSTAGKVLAKSAPFVGIAFGLGQGIYDTRNEDLNWEQRSARVIFEGSKAAVTGAASIAFTPYGGAAVGVALDYVSDPLYHGLVEIPGQFLGEHVTYPIGHALGFYP